MKIRHRSNLRKIKRGTGYPPGTRIRASDGAIYIVQPDGSFKRDKSSKSSSIPIFKADFLIPPSRLTRSGQVKGDKGGCYK